MTINQSREAVGEDYREDLMTNGVVGLTIGVQARRSRVEIRRHFHAECLMGPVDRAVANGG